MSDFNTTRPFRNDLNQIPYDYTVEVRNRFKGLDLIDTVPDGLWTEVQDIVQETGIKTIPKNGNAKECSNCCTIALISHTSKVTLKIVKAGLQQYVNRKLPDVQTGFGRGRGTKDQVANICCIIERAREFQKNIYFCFIDYAKSFDCVDHNKLENSERDRNSRPSALPLEKPICRSGSNS